MTRKQLFIAIAVALTLGVAAFIYIVYGQDSGDTTQNNNQGTVVNGKNVTAEEFGELYSNGQTRQCSYTRKTDTLNLEGNFYFSNNRSYAKITSTQSGTTTKINQIFKSDESYTWTEGETSGIRIKTTADELKKEYQSSMDQADPAARQKAEQEAKETVISCTSWKVDESKFTPPTTVDFREVSL